MITLVLRRVWGDILGFIIVIFIMFLVYFITVSGFLGKSFRVGFFGSKGFLVVGGRELGLGRFWEFEGDGGFFEFRVF